MINDFFLIFYWWLLLFGLGVICFPFSFFFFQKFWDQGYALNKIISLLFISYLTWFLASIRLLPFFAETVWLIILILGVVNFFLAKKQKLHFKKIISQNQSRWLFEEVLFFLTLAFWAFIRGFQPNIQGLEKFMDFGFVNSILRSRFFPPADMWLAGKTINYYYFGHLITAVLTKLSGLDSAVTYNLMIATIFAFAFTITFSLGANLTLLLTQSKKTSHRQRSVFLGGILFALLLTFGSNLHPLWWFLTHGNFKTYWYPDATRFIVQKFGAADNTIHEFPVYSFVVADLHGHLLNLPSVLLFLSLILAVFIQKKLSWPFFLFTSFLLSLFYITNAWDFPVYFLILGATILFFNYLKYGPQLKTLSQTFFSAGSCLLAAIIFFLPFQLHFKSIAQGIALTDFHSPFWMLLVLWGLPLLMTLSFLVFLVLTNRRKKLHWERGDYFISLLLLVAWFLVLIPERFYLKDIYIHSHQRANTMFKLTYQAFVMFSLVNSYLLVKILTSLKKSLLKTSLSCFYALLFVFPLLYPFFAIRSYYGLKNYRGLNGLQYLGKSYPDDYQAILWLRQNVVGQPVIVEAVGESYTDFARVSANTGLPTILGWRVHEWLWRGSFDEPATRTEVVKKIYQSPSLEETKQLLQKYQAQYLFLGSLERKQYPNLLEEKFSRLGKVVYQSGKTRIYQLEID